MSDLESEVKSPKPEGKKSSKTEDSSESTTTNANSAGTGNGMRSRVIVIVKSWNDLPIGKFGTYMSFGVLICGIIASIIGQKYAPTTINTPTPYSATNLNKSQWLLDCPSGYENVCIGNGAVYRFSFALVIIYALQLIGTTVYIKFFDILWVPKCLIFAVICICFFYADASVFDENGYAWFARIAAFFYLILQQVILLDFAYTWNEKWVTKAEDHGGDKWYTILLIVSLVLLLGSYTIIGLMFWQFMGCVENLVILSLTVALPFIATFIQLFLTDDGSLLTSSVMTAYATYVCYSAVTLNPDLTCNPTISTNYQTIATIIGMILTVVSLIWTTASVIQQLPETTSIEEAAGSYALNESNTGTPAPTARTSVSVSSDNKVSTSSGLRYLLQQVSVVFILISTYYAMILTNWGTLQSSYDIAVPKSGQVAMWLQASGQWIAILLYIWSMIAPKLFPDRDFS